MIAAVECVVIGAGGVGLGVARALARGGCEVLVLEKERWIGSEASSRNSEVIHAGLHYPKGSLKARFCVAGRDWLYAYCAERGIPHKRLGKLTDAIREEELPILEGVWRRAAANGVNDLECVGGSEARALEPELSCLRAFPPLDRHHRQPRAHARLPGRARSGRRHGGAARAGGGGPRHRAGVRASGGRGPAAGARLPVFSPQPPHPFAQPRPPPPPPSPRPRPPRP